jgi:MFS family permease
MCASYGCGGTYLRERRRLWTSAPLAGALADRIGERPLLVGGLSLHAAGTPGWG